MRSHPKRSDRLTEADFHQYSVWRETSPEPNEFGWRLAPITRLPVESLRGCWVGTQCVLANGASRFLVSRFVSERNPKITEHFVVLTAFTATGQVHLRQYHAPDRAVDEPARFAEALGFSADDVFPIRFDLTEVCSGDRAALAGLVWDEPKERLPEDELMELCLTDLEDS